MSFDPVTAAMAARSARVEAVKQRSPFGTVATRIFGGRMSTVNIASATTYHVACEAPAEFDAVQIIFANTDNSNNWPISAAGVCALPSAADLNGSSETWTVATKNGPGMTRVNQRSAAGGSRVAYTLTDPIPVKSVARTDGGTKPILAARAYFAASSALPVVGNGTDSFTNWATRTGKRWVMRSEAVDGASFGNFGNFTSTTNQSQSPIVGFRFWLRGRVVNVMGVGDSIQDGRGTYLGAGFLDGICDDLSSSRLTFTYANLGWSGQLSSQFFPRIMDALRDPHIRPDILVFPAMSPNDGGTPPLTQAMFDAAAMWRTQIIAECRRRGVMPVIWTTLPVDDAVNDWGSSDALRTADNAAVLAMAGRDVLVADTADDFETTLDGDGQMQVDPALVSDGIHPNDTGYTVMKNTIKPQVAKAAGLR